MAGAIAAWVAIGMATVLCLTAYFYFGASAAKVDLARLKAKHAGPLIGEGLVLPDAPDLADYDLADAPSRWSSAVAAEKEMRAYAKTVRQVQEADAALFDAMLKHRYRFSIEDEEMIGEEPPITPKRPSRQKVGRDES